MMSDLLQACIKTEEAYAVIAQYAPRLFPNESGALYVCNGTQNMVEEVAVWGELPATKNTFAPNDCWALRRGRTHLVTSPSELFCRHLSQLPLTGYQCLPMMAQGEALGVLYLRGTPPEVGKPEEMRTGWPESKQRLSVTVAENIALALSNLKLRETLRLQAIRDPLTGIFNRRYMEESLEREARRAARNEKTLGVIMLDLDH